MCDEELNIQKELNDNHAYANDFKVMFNERKSSNGFNFDACNDNVLVARIQKLYGVVYIKKKITSGAIGVSFVKVVIAEKKGCVVNWSCFTTQV